MKSIDATVWQNRSVFITGHTGFKGSWLTLWLAKMGARVSGFALAPQTTPDLFSLAAVEQDLIAHHVADIRDQKMLDEAMQAAQPEVIFHLAAQPLVRKSYLNPQETWSTNVIGTVNVLEAARRCPSVRAIVVITTDKCYENQEWVWGYRESDPLGGFDPYSASKAATEIVIQSYRRSFFGDQGILMASARAGNVIGGGDFSEDRLIPDAARAVMANNVLVIRNPQATRPWQHVLESLNGYLLLAQRLLSNDQSCATAFNFGPEAFDNIPVSQILANLQTYWPKLTYQTEKPNEDAFFHEANFLYLDSTKARHFLGWHSHWTLLESLEKTAHWYHMLAENVSMRTLTLLQIEQFEGKNE